MIPFLWFNNKIEYKYVLSNTVWSIFANIIVLITIRLVTFSFNVNANVLNLLLIKFIIVKCWPRLVVFIYLDVEFIFTISIWWFFTNKQIDYYYLFYLFSKKLRMQVSLRSISSIIFNSPFPSSPVVQSCK